MDNKKTTLYINILLQSLKKKNTVLDELILLSEQQGIIVSNGSKQSTKEEFEKIIDRKSILIDQLNEIDEGFYSVYNRTKEELNENPLAYQSQVAELKEIITQITDKGIKLEAIERRNKPVVLKWMESEKGRIKQYHVSRKSTTNYYNTMNKINPSETYFFDQKK